jgi:membrane protease YdiL (CAAX protease family)
MVIKLNSLTLTLIRSLLIFAFYLLFSISLTYGIIAILSTLNITPIVQVILMQFFLFLFTSITVFGLENRKLLNVAPKYYSLKEINLVTICFISLATTLFTLIITNNYQLIYTISSNPINNNYQIGIFLNIVNILSVIVLAPYIEETIFRKWILGSFAMQGKQVYLGLIISTLLFYLIHYGDSIFPKALSGIILGLIFLRFGVRGSIYFHATHNLFWVILQDNKNNYQKLLRWLDYGFLYWLLFLISSLLIIMFVINSLKFIRITYGNDSNHIAN